MTSSWQVNHSPSFTTDSRLDREVKDALLCDAMTLVNLQGCDKRKVMEEDKRRVKERLFQCHQQPRDTRCSRCLTYLIYYHLPEHKSASLGGKGGLGLISYEELFFGIDNILHITDKMFKIQKML